MAMESIKSSVDLDASHITDIDIIRYFYPDVKVICSDKFMQLSKNAYPLPWLAREIVQNFVDANPNRGTLDGVKTKIQDVENDKKRVIITGTWLFKDPTSIISLDSDKAIPVNKGKTAGGNGIGLKQTILRLLRDYGVTDFKILGEGWETKYKLLSQDSINAALFTEGYTKRLSKDWLIGDIAQHDNKGQIIYSFHVSNADAIETFGRIGELGVSNENPYLQHPDISNTKGSLKWIQPFDVGNSAHGRLFINGQIMRMYENRKKDFWGGPQFFSLRLNDVNYEMSIDRPRIYNHELTHYMTDFLDQLTSEEMRTLLRQTESIWIGKFADEHWDVWEKDLFIFTLLEKIFLRLKKEGLDYQDLETMFQRKMLYKDRDFNPDEKKEIEASGYTLMHNFFALMKMSPASLLVRKNLHDELDPEKAAENKRNAAKTYGIEVYVPRYRNRSLTELRTFLHHIKVSCDVISDTPSDTTVVLNIGKDFDENDILEQFPDSDDEQSDDVLNFLRVLAYKGIQNHQYTTSIETSNTSCTFDGITPIDLRKKSENSRITPITPGYKLNFKMKLFQKIKDLDSLSNTGSTLVYLTFKNIKGKKDFLNQFILMPPSPGIIQRLIQRNATKVFVLLGLLSVAGVMLYKNRSLSFSDFDMETAMEEIDLRKFDNIDLRAFLDKYEKANIPGGLPESPDLYQPQPSDLIVGEYEKVPASEQQIQQLELLKTYVQILTGYEVPNDFFVYRGDGAKGLNESKKAIGLHEAMFSTSFDEALNTFIHEITHNMRYSHDVRFAKMISALHMFMHDSLKKKLGEVIKSKKLNKETQLILNAEKMWTSLQTSP